MSGNPWYDHLIDKNHFQAFKIIWDPKRNLTPKQRQALVKYHEKINREKINEKWSQPEAWLEEEHGGDNSRRTQA